MADTAREAACRAAYAKFPELVGLAPTERAHGPRREYTFRRVCTVDGARLEQIVRVTVGANGRVMKVIASR
jgi:hypothetical protein